MTQPFPLPLSSDIGTARAIREHGHPYPRCPGGSDRLGVGEGARAAGRLSRRLGVPDPWSERSHRGHRGRRHEAGAFTDRRDRAARDLRRPGGDRDRERAPVQRAAGADRRAHSARSSNSRRSARSGRRSARRWTWRPCSRRSSRGPSQLSGRDGGVVFEYDEGADMFVPRATHRHGREPSRRLVREGECPQGRGRGRATAITLRASADPGHPVAGAYESHLRGDLDRAGDASAARGADDSRGRLDRRAGREPEPARRVLRETVELLQTFADAVGPGHPECAAVPGRSRTRVGSSR